MLSQAENSGPARINAGGRGLYNALIAFTP
jgi:hypothetical protein